MQIVRVILAAIFAVVAMLAGLFTAAFVAVVALVAYLVLMLRGKTRTAAFGRPPTSPKSWPHRESRSSGDDVIDVEASEVRGAKPEETLPRKN